MKLNYLVIGGSSGIGKQITTQLAMDDFRVFATYSKNKIESDNELISYHDLNVFDENPSLEFLPESLNGFIYCPGSIHLKPFERIHAHEFESDYKLQVVGAIKLIQRVLPLLKQSINSSILLFSTVAVQMGLPFHTQVAASKGAIEGLTKSLAAELAPKVRVNCIAPSLTNTPLANTLLNTEQKIASNAQRHPLKRVGEVEDIANMATFLLSEKASWITGQILHIDGGFSTIKL